MFAVEAGGVMSETSLVNVQILPGLWMQTQGIGEVTANVDVSPNQPELPVDIQRASGSSWVTVASGHTDIIGDYVVTVTGQPAGRQTYRAYVGGDPPGRDVELLDGPRGHGGRHDAAAAAAAPQADAGAVHAESR